MTSTETESQAPKDCIALRIAQCITYVTEDLADYKTGGTVSIHKGYRGFYLGPVMRAEFEQHPDWKKLQAVIRKKKAVGQWTEKDGEPLYEIYHGDYYHRRALEEMRKHITDVRRFDILSRFHSDGLLAPQGIPTETAIMLAEDVPSLAFFFESGAWANVSQMLVNINVSRLDYTWDNNCIFMKHISQMGSAPHSDDFIVRDKLELGRNKLPSKDALNAFVADVLAAAKKSRREMAMFSVRHYHGDLQIVAPLAPKKRKPAKLKTPKT